MLRFLPMIGAAFLVAACVKGVKTTQKHIPLTSLAGSEWSPENVNDIEQYVQFGAAGDVSGHGGCNRFFGTYEQSGERLTIGALASTKMACTGKMQAEAGFLNNLQSTRRIEASHMRLVLKDEGETPLMILRRRDWD
ncbi:MAG: META domain-containing protein [Maricaulaceae bacterium]